MNRFIPTVSTLLVLGACAVGPRYVAPEPGSAVIANAAATGLERRSPDAAWWQEFGDPTLDALMRRAFAGSPDLRIALARVKEARALFVRQELDYGPHVSADGTYVRSREQVPGFGSSRADVESASLGFDASWELDLFGHVRHSVEAARADLGAEQAGYDAAAVTLAAEVARNYFELRGTQRRLDVARESLAREQKSLELTELREQAGRGAELDVARSRARLKATAATIPPLEAAEKGSEYRLAVLLGAKPGALEADLAPVATAAFAKSLPIGDPTELLRHRPDVRVAERQLAAATAQVGIATADLFPRVTVTGFVGFLSGDVKRLFGTTPGLDTRAWSVNPSVGWAAFDLGSLHARLRASRAHAEGVAANYEKVVLAALEDTENSFLGYAKHREQLELLGEQAGASRRAAELADIQYREGVADYLTLLDAERTKLDADDAVAQAETAVNVSVVAIYKALGGVGQPPAAALASAAAPAGIHLGVSP